MDSTLESGRKSNYGGSLRYGGSNQATGSIRMRRNRESNSFIHDSYNSSLDFPAYIPWQTLSSDVSDKLRTGSIKINKCNCVEWTTIKEENERVPLLDRKNSESGSDLKLKDIGLSEAVSSGITWPVAAFLLINCALGAGVLNYPAAYDRLGGVLIATLIQLAMMLVLAATMIILVYSSDLNNDDTYHDVLLSMCGKRAQQLSAISILLTCYGVCVTFLIIIGDQYDRIFVTHLTECTWYVDRRFTISISAFFLILPMCYFRRLDFLRYAGTLGVFAMLYVVFINIYEFMKLDIPNPVIKTRSYTSMIAIFPVVTFAYQCHEITIPVYACMEKRNIRNFSKATALALGILFILYCAAGTSGYLTFGAGVTPDIMALYDASDPVVIIGILALALKMITTYPSMILCGRGALDGLYAEYMDLSAEDFIAGERTRRIVITTVWFVTSLLFAIFTPNIGIVIELLGSLASANVFIFPSFCLISIARRETDQFSRRTRIFFIIFAISLIITGFSMFLLVLNQVYQDLSSEQPHHDVLCK
ncbi:sodium-coupled neutral amino acid transporter 7-like isoform X2 [Brevipalpus obovatus]|uniref:sodium-coupled neutral amino acid transporter 7-like isoform X2 n=1 Tax=Brevipalpus obovatus TaxID=246614 RepID=UPI003D9E35A7